MFSKIKYVLFDYSDKFKDDFWSLFTKTALLLIAGIIMFALSGINDTLGSIGAFALLIFGLIWGREIVGLIPPPSFVSNFVIRMFWIMFSFMLSFIVGFIYFAWCVVKIVICYIKGNTVNNVNTPIVENKNSNFERYKKFVAESNDESKLDKMHDDLLCYVLEIPSPIPVAALIDSNYDRKLDEEAKAQYRAFCKRPLPNGELYGCRTYGEAQEMNRVVVKRSEELDKMNQN